MRCYRTENTILQRVGVLSESDFGCKCWNIFKEKASRFIKKSLAFICNLALKKYVSKSCTYVVLVCKIVSKLVVN